jgi:2,3-bisphosphoglycerate-dependent phosphoglycerate mutase
MLIVVRHGESEWNARGVWTGTTDVELDTKGHYEGVQMGKLLADIHLDHAFTSNLIRTQETLNEILETTGQTDVPKTISPDIRERDYGDYTGQNKWEIRESIGEAAFASLRRDWNYPVPGGETLKDVYERTVPCYEEEILPLLLKGQNVLVVAHGNSIRSLVKYIETVSDQDISKVEMIFGQAIIYTVNSEGKMLTKAIRQIDTVPPPA